LEREKSTRMDFEASNLKLWDTDQLSPPPRVGHHTAQDAVSLVK